MLGADLDILDGSPRRAPVAAVQIRVYRRVRACRVMNKGPVWSSARRFSEWQIVFVDFIMIDGLRLTLLTGQFLEIGLVEGPDSFAQVVDEFENGNRLLGCPVGGDRQRDGVRESRPKRCFGMIRNSVEHASLATLAPFRSPFGHLSLMSSSIAARIAAALQKIVAHER
jgi:hypothetical protein